MKNIVLIGFMGSGKSTVGKMLATELKLPFLDTDDLVEARAGRAIKDIFKAEGEDRFRILEKEVVKEVSLRPSQVIACGGGVVLDDENTHSLKENGVLVYLKVSPSVACQRTEVSNDRPLLKGSRRQETIEKLLCAREEIYEKVADFAVSTSILTPEQAVEEIEKKLKQRGIIS